MTSNYKKIGDYIRLVDNRDKELEVETLLGLSIAKEFIPSVANTVGTNMANYKIIKKGQFACSLMQVRRDKKIPVALQRYYKKAIVSQAYPVFEIIDSELLEPEYLMMWMSRSEFDRHACFLAVGGVRGSLEWADFCDMELPVPSIEKQREIVGEYNVVNDRIVINEQLTKKLEDTAHAIYKKWFIDFEFPITKDYAESIGKPELEGKPYKSSGGRMVYCEKSERNFPALWNAGNLRDVSNLIDGDRGKNYPNKEKMQNHGHCLFLNTGNVTKTGFLFEGKLERNDLVITTRGTIGNVARYSKVIPYDHIRINSGMLIIRVKDKIYANFVFSMLKSREMRQRIDSFVSGSAQPQLPVKDIIKIGIILPPENYIASYSKTLQIIYDYEDNLKSSQNQLRKFSEIILQKMSKG
jgi:type I restriction enzyme S subunit